MKSTCFAGIARTGAMNSSGAPPPAWRNTACTCKRKPSTYGYREPRPRSFGMQLWLCIGAEWDTMPRQISSTWMWAGCGVGELAIKRFIEAVDVIEEVGHAILADDGGLIDDVHRDGVRQVHLARQCPRAHRRENPLLRPPWAIFQDPSSQHGGFLHADAPVTEIPSRVGKQASGGRVVQIDVVGVGKN